MYCCPLPGWHTSIPAFLNASSLFAPLAAFVILVAVVPLPVLSSADPVFSSPPTKEVI